MPITREDLFAAFAMHAIYVVKGGPPLCYQPMMEQAADMADALDYARSEQDVECAAEYGDDVVFVNPNAPHASDAGHSSTNDCRSFVRDPDALRYGLLRVAAEPIDTTDLTKRLDDAFVPLMEAYASLDTAGRDAVRAYLEAARTVAQEAKQLREDLNALKAAQAPKEPTNG